jgi:hypothetical protein
MARYHANPTYVKVIKSAGITLEISCAIEISCKCFNKSILRGFQIEIMQPENKVMAIILGG